MTLPAQMDALSAEQISAAFTPGVTVVIADLTATACRDCSAIRQLLKAHRQAATRGSRVRFVIRPGTPLSRITDFTGTHPLLAVYPTLQHALAGDSPDANPASTPRPGGYDHLSAVRLRAAARPPIPARARAE